jgi:hypothetical protein
MLLQWPHQGARNFTKTFLFDPRTAESKFLSVAWNAAAFAKSEAEDAKREKVRAKRKIFIVEKEQEEEDDDLLVLVVVIIARVIKNKSLTKL